jgi:outer membrane lipoprotein
LTAVRQKLKGRPAGGRAFVFLLLSALLLTSGCATAISRDFRKTAEPPLPFETLLAQPDLYKGRKVVLGGSVLEVKNEPDMSSLTVLQTPLDMMQRPKDDDLSQGRFIIRARQFLDPEVYSKGREVTVGGSVVGSVRQPLGDREYTYPVIEAQELHLWPIPSVRPGYPYYYYPWYDDYWYGAPYPWYRRHYPWGGWSPWYP